MGRNETDEERDARAAAEVKRMRDQRAAEVAEAERIIAEMQARGEK